MGSLPPFALAATVIVIAACTFDLLPQTTPTGDDNRRERPPHRRAVQTPTPVAVATPVETASPGPIRATVSVADQLRTYLSRVLDGPTSSTGWRRHIRRVTVGLHTAAIHTDLSSSEDDRITAEQICMVTSWFKHSPEGRHVTSLDVEVYGEHGVLLAAYEDTSDRTSARTGRWTRPATPSRLPPADHRPSPTPAAPRLGDGRRAS